MNFLPRKNRWATVLVSSCILLSAGMADAQFVPNNQPNLYDPSVTYSRGTLVGITHGNYVDTYRALGTSKGLAPTVSPAAWEMYELRSPSYTITVKAGTAFPDLKTAWKYVTHAVIGRGPEPTGVSSNIPPALHIHISGNLNEQFTGPLNLDHPYGANIEIFGDPTAAVNLTFFEPTPTSNGTPFNGIVLDTGHYLYGLRNVNVTAVNDAVGDTGIYVDTSASLNIGNVSVDNFYYGVQANRGARLYCTIPPGSSNSLTLATFAFGVNAFESSFIQCDNIVITGDQSSQYGMQAQNHSEIHANQASISNVAFTGVTAYDNSTVYVHQATVSHCKDAYVAYNRGFIMGDGSSASSFSEYGYKATHGSFIDGTGVSGLAAISFTDSTSNIQP